MNLQNRSVKRTLIIGVVILLILFFGYNFLNKSGSTKTASTSSLPRQTNVAPAKATVEINKPFTFALPAEIAKNNEKITFTILTAEKKDEIKVKGEARKAPSGKDYLLVRLELDNPTVQRIKFTSADFIRLIGENDKKFSPDYHNGAITLDPISVRRDLISFLIDENQKQFAFQVGELTKDKERIEIQFQ